MKRVIKHRFAWLALVVSFMQVPALSAANLSLKTNTTQQPAYAPGARDIIKEIIDVVGLKPRFEVREANVDNAAAVVYNGQRYILYNRQFVAAVNNASKTDWAAVSILAHEIGHHLNGHTLTRGGSNPQDELEADEFSGFVLKKMGASLADAQAAISLLSEERASQTHPGRSTRLASISKGWRNAESQILANTNGATKARPVVRQEQPVETVVAQTPTRQVTQVSLSRQDILRKVTFRSVPGENFYVTRKFNLVHISDDGKLQVVGKMAPTNNRNYPFVLQSSYFNSLFIGNDGYLISENGDRVGYLS